MCEHKLLMGYTFIGPLALVSYLSQPMFTHEAALVYITINAINAPFTCILPHSEVAIVDEFGLACGVLRYHKWVAINLASQVAVVKIGEGV